MKKLNLIKGIILSTLIIFLAFGKDKVIVDTDAFQNGGFIPKRYTCEGKNISPSVSWYRFPKSAKSFVLIMDDPDAPMGTFTHWIVYDIPANVNSLKEGFSRSSNLPNGIKQGINDFGKVGYDGPCPPKYQTHRYFIKIKALNIRSLNLPPKVDRETLDKALTRYKNNIVGEGYIYGLFRR
ncbi:MAG: YbhB/YbcL family Raf kinase inhibitor-like protein [Persephonella sp.]|nr:MAG: YbhB/YbcL family Raf kinase inhibitor-like protein [Persephonella sp.]RUM61102.1 MAG: YbhB/YbcL family Raf kinase inhibitor-like protein [Persephonella sp.]